MDSINRVIVDEAATPNMQTLADILDSADTSKRCFLMLRFVLRHLSYALLTNIDLTRSDKEHANLGAEKSEFISDKDRSNSNIQFLSLKFIIASTLSVFDTGTRLTAPYGFGKSGTLSSDLKLAKFAFQLRIRPKNDDVVELFYWPRSKPSYMDKVYFSGSMRNLLAEMEYDAHAYEDATWRNNCPKLFNLNDNRLTVPSDLLALMKDNEDWRFWHRWYRGFLEGHPLNWELQRRVALIDDAIWDAGPKAVAAKIREIEAEFAGPAPLEDAALRTHVAHLLSNPTLTEATALNGAETIERAIADYLREAPANCLPEDLKHLEVLPQYFKAIAHVIGSQAAKDEKENRLIDEISKLHARVAELEKELAVAKSKELKGVISLEAAKAFGKTIGSPYFYGGIAMGVSYFFGVSPSDMTFENLRGYVGELWRANSEGTVSSPPYLPPSTDV